MSGFIVLVKFHNIFEHFRSHKPKNIVITFMILLWLSNFWLFILLLAPGPKRKNGIPHLQKFSNELTIKDVTDTKCNANDDSSTQIQFITHKSFTRIVHFYVQ